MLVEADAGSVQERRAGGGAVDIYVLTRFADRTTEQARRIANELGIGLRTTVQIDTGKAGR
jgi:hypothetical protein